MIICVDPGLSGAIVLLSSDGNEILKHTMMPTAAINKKQTVSAPLVADFINECLQMADQRGQRLTAVVEQVNAMPGQGVTSMFNFGKSFGTVIGVLGALKIPTSFITPQSWKHKFRLMKQQKDASRALALQKFPQQSELFKTKAKGQAIADAVFIGLASIG